MTKLLIIGSGNMGSAMLRGLSGRAGNQVHIEAIDQNAELVAELKARYRANALVKITKDQPEKGSLYDGVVLCTKPQDLTRLADWLPDFVSEATVILSILAGVRIEQIRNDLRHHGPIFRAMPNIAALVNEAATAVCTDYQTSSSQRELAENVFSAFGEVFWTEERLMDAVTGLSGSGPAYVYMLIEALIDGAVRVGMPRKLATKLAAQTVLGAAKMVKTTELHPAVLKDQVTTPGGTTIHALHEMESQGFRSILMNAVSTATIQSAALGKLSGSATRK